MRESAESNIPGRYNHLARFTLFADLNEQALNLISQRLHRWTFRAGGIIYHRYALGRVCYFISKGKVKLSLRDRGGHAVTLALLTAGQCFGELALIDGQRRSSDAIAVDHLEGYTLQ